MLFRSKMEMLDRELLKVFGSYKNEIQNKFVYVLNKFIEEKNNNTGLQENFPANHILPYFQSINPEIFDTGLSGKGRGSKLADRIKDIALDIAGRAGVSYSR